MSEQSQDMSSGQEERAERERLLEKSRQILRRMRFKCVNHVLLALGVFILLDIPVWLMREGGASESTLHGFANGVMTLNGLVSMYLLVKPLFIAHIAIGTMKRGMAEFERGEYGANEEYARYFIRQAEHFVSKKFPYFHFNLTP